MVQVMDMAMDMDIKHVLLPITTMDMDMRREGQVHMRLIRLDISVLDEDQKGKVVGKRYSKG